MQSAQIVLLGNLAFEASQVVGVIAERRCFHFNKIFGDGLMFAPIVLERHADFGGGFFSREVARDFFLRRNENFQIAFDDGLACERIPSLQIIRAQTHGRASARVAAFNNDGATSTSTLPTARHVNIDARLCGGIGNQIAVIDLYSFIEWLEMDSMRNDGEPLNRIQNPELRSQNQFF
jgi:hypothetical protein